MEQINLIHTNNKTYIAYESDINPRYWLAIEITLDANNVIAIEADKVALLPKILCKAQSTIATTTTN